ncbi:SRPBCC domain-containing protein [Rhodococcus phenolicus]|uniref:SRPBCC domain-containing protein n=1 Tax=Rhodococcus phenolicus TaxID=263849 RepID=UPI00082F6B6A|nr:SRPBCC domain-containing protein [Rhodococcus phenolicus]
MSTPTTVLGEVRPEHDCPADAVLVSLHYQRSFPLPIASVWAAVTEPDALAAWYGRWTGDPSSGRVRLTMTDEHDRATTDIGIVECAGPRLLVLDVDGWRLELRLRQVGQVTTLEFTHRHVPRSEAAAIGPGWQYYLDRLDTLLMGRKTPRWADYAELGESYR